jgi:hypothetical protein
MKSDHLHALTLLAGYPAHGFGPAVIAELIEHGLVRAKTERVLTSRYQGVRVTRLRITKWGRAAMEGR